jgi:hypothetical protein
MPETFNFTARATAASGAFADRAFSITVNNSVIPRLVVVSQSGAARALAAAQPWINIPGVKGDSVAWGDRWLVWDGPAGVMWRSPDTINWISLTPTLPSGYTTLSHLRWRAGAWWALGGTGAAIGVLTSTDGGQTWTLVGAAQAATFAASFERSEAGASIIANESDWYYRANDAAAWVPVKTFGASGAKFQIAHLNGIWFGPSSLAVSPGVARSVDGSAWFDQSNASVLTAGYYRGFAYVNGSVVAHCYSDPLTGYTTDAGITIQATNALPAASTTFSTDSPITAQAGRVVMLGDGGRTFSANSATTAWSAQTIPGGWGGTSIAARP